MTGGELRAALGDLGVSQRQFAHYIGRSFSVVNRWVLGLIRVPRYAEVTVEALKREMADG